MSRGSLSRLSAAGFAALALAVAACGGDDGSGSGGGAQAAKAVSLKVGVLPIADVAPLYLGMQQGFFKAENLTIEPAVAEGGAAVVPAVMSGDNQIGFSNVTSIMNGKAQNLPLKPLAAGVNGAASEDKAWDALLVPKGASTDLKSLEGKKVSVNTLKNLPEVAVRNSLEKAGVDVSKVQFVEIPFPDVPAALEAKRVDAAFAVEPALSSALAGGATKVAEPFEELAPDLTIAEYFTTEKYAAENQGVIERFTRAMNKSLDYAQQNPDATRKIITTYTKTPQTAAAKMTLPTWNSKVNGTAMTSLVGLSKKYGVLSGNVDVNGFVALG